MGLPSGRGVWTEPDSDDPAIDLVCTSLYNDARTANLTWASGRAYVGQVRDGRPHGQGTETEAGGASTYVGAFVLGRYDGSGVMRNQDGSSYEGAFVAGQRHGQGTYRFSATSQYAGAWEHGQPWGYGIWGYADGSAHMGHWRAGLKHGSGVATAADGRQSSGTWADDRRVS